MSIIDFKNVSFKYRGSDNFALENIDFSVNEGEFIAVMGENGSGKTTLCRLINAVIPHLTGGKLTGAVTVNGSNTKDIPVKELALNVGAVMDDPDAQVFASTVFQEAAFGPENILLAPDEIKKRVNEALSCCGLNGFEERLTSALSGGEKQRLCIAAALCMNGKILVLDEPLCRLDPDGREDVMKVLKTLREKKQLTIIMASHESEKMLEYADRVLVLNKGKTAAVDTAEKIFADTELLEKNGIQPVITNKNFTANHHEPSRTQEDTIINIRDITFRYPNGSGIENINISIYKNDFVAITGKNGCGKTTLLKNITGLLKPAYGEILINGKNIKKMSVSGISKEIGYVMQNPDTQLFSDTLFKEVSFALKNTRLKKNEIKMRVQEALDIVGLKDSDVYPHALPRADRTKAVIACVLAMGCRILIFDEVDVGNDYQGSLKIMNIARDLCKKGFTIIFVTHNMKIAEEYANRIIKMEKREIIYDERPA